MIDQAYRKINQLLDQDIYRETCEFHTKTNNFFLVKNPTNELLGLAIQKNLKEIEHSDIPICPFDIPRIYLRQKKDSQHFPRRQQSATHFIDKVLPVVKLMQLLQSAFGNDSETKNNFRPYPSGGALYSVQAIVGIRTAKIAFNLESFSAGFSTGFYHYRPTLNALDRINNISDEEMLTLFLNQQNLKFYPFNFCILYTSFLAKSMCKYGYRGYRLSLLEAGSMYQQASLCANSLGLTSRVWSAFDDHHLNKVLGLHPVSYLPLIAQLFGYSDD